ncbi:MAG: hypothetical protein WCO44_12415 [Bacteroidota bacterium]
MKKILVLSAILLIASTTFAQKSVLASYGDTLSGASTKYYPAPAFSDLQYGSFQVWFDHLTGSLDSTYVSFQGSIDGVNWITLQPTTYANTVTIGATAPTDFTPCRFYQTDGGMIWTISNSLKLPFYRLAVQHWVTGTASIKAWMYKKK